MNAALLASRMTQPTPILAALMFSLGCIAATRCFYKQLLKLADDDADGRLSFDEIRRFVRAGPGQLWRMSVAELTRGQVKVQVLEDEPHKP